MAIRDTPTENPLIILNEVFSTEGIAARTELTDQEIKNINLASTLAVAFNNKLLALHIKDFMTLKKSRNRGSMREFVEVVKGKFEKILESGKEGINFFGKA